MRMPKRERNRHQFNKRHPLKVSLANSSSLVLHMHYSNGFEETNVDRPQGNIALEAANSFIFSPELWCDSKAERMATTFQIDELRSIPDILLLNPENGWSQLAATCSLAPRARALQIAQCGAAIWIMTGDIKRAQNFTLHEVKQAIGSMDVRSLEEFEAIIADVFWDSFVPAALAHRASHLPEAIRQANQVRKEIAMSGKPHAEIIELLGAVERDLEMTLRTEFSDYMASQDLWRESNGPKAISLDSLAALAIADMEKAAAIIANIDASLPGTNLVEIVEDVLPPSLRIALREAIASLETPKASVNFVDRAANNPHGFSTHR